VRLDARELLAFALAVMSGVAADRHTIDDLVDA
jgi:hypothetical protein